MSNRSVHDNPPSERLLQGVRDRLTAIRGERDLSLQGIRDVFNSIQQVQGIPFKKLQANARVWWSTHQQQLGAAARDWQPCSYNTFRALMSDSVPAHPVRTLPYFAVLSEGVLQSKVRANDELLDRIRSVLMEEVVRRRSAREGARIAMHLPRRDAEALAVASGYDRPLREISAQSGFRVALDFHSYVVGDLGDRVLPSTTEPDESWGLLHHLRYLGGQLRRQRLVMSSGNLLGDCARRLEIAVETYALYLADHPAFASMVTGRRPFVLFSKLSHDLQLQVVDAAKECMRSAWEPLRDLVAGLLEPKDLGFDLAIAVERGTERAVGLAHDFHQIVVFGGTGTGALYRAAYQLRRKSQDSAEWSESHEQLVASYDRALTNASKLPYNTSYRDVERVFSDQFKGAISHMKAVWRADYHPEIVPVATSSTLRHLLRRGILDRAEHDRALNRVYDICDYPSVTPLADLE